MNIPNVFNPFLGGKTKSQVGRLARTTSKTLEGIDSIVNRDNPEE
jgi:hypothetical protein